MNRKPYTKIGSLSEIVDFLKIVGEIQQLVQTFTDNSLRRINSTSYISIELSKILPQSKIIKNAKKLLAFGENNSHRLSNFLHIFIFFYKYFFIIFETLIVFLESTIKLITEIFDFRYKCFIQRFFRKRPAP